MGRLAADYKQAKAAETPQQQQQPSDQHDTTSDWRPLAIEQRRGLVEVEIADSENASVAEDEQKAGQPTLLEADEHSSDPLSFLERLNLETD